MKKIATLGPPGTFSEIAAEQFCSGLDEQHSIEFYPSVKRAFWGIGRECDYGVLPIENQSDGFVQVMLDLLVNCDLEIIGEILLPVQFSFVANRKEISQIRKVYAQFAARGQCADFLDNLTDARIEITESNMESLQRVEAGKPECGAVVPFHSIEDKSFPLTIGNITDYRNNLTRFIVLRKKGEKHRRLPGCKTSLIILDDEDRPGLLVDILNSFSARKINLTSIISRPTKEAMGKYHFFIDIDGHIDDEHVSSALDEIGRSNRVQVLGSYPKAQLEPGEGKS